MTEHPGHSPERGMRRRSDPTDRGHESRMHEVSSGWKAMTKEAKTSASVLLRRATEAAAERRRRVLHRKAGGLLMM